LNDLGGETLYYRCLSHPGQGQSVTIRSDTDYGNLTCPVQGANCLALGGKRLFSGVVVWHEGCSARPPYGNLSAVQNVNHWMVSAAREVNSWRLPSGSLSLEGESVSPETASMWFPLPLLQATKRVAPRDKNAAMIALVGPMKVGKTVLSLLALDAEGYKPDCVTNLGRKDFEQQVMSLDDYIYVSPEEGQALPIQDWVDHLRTRSEMERNEAVSNWPNATTPYSHNVKAVFFGAPPSQDPPPSRVFLPLLKNTLKTFLGQSEHGLAWGAVVCFRDTSGEQAQAAADPNLAHTVLPEMDVQAVLVEANDLSCQSEDATTRLRQATALLGVERQNQTTCLVITKMDNLPNQTRHLITQTQTYPEKAVDGSLGREWLLDYLQQNPNDCTQELLNIVNSRQTPVFPVWTDAFATTPPQVPHGYGITALVLWSLSL